MEFLDPLLLTLLRTPQAFLNNGKHALRIDRFNCLKISREFMEVDGNLNICTEAATEALKASAALPLQQKLQLLQPR